LQMTPPLETWFKALVWSEVVLQLPFFVVGAYALFTPDDRFSASKAKGA